MKLSVPKPPEKPPPGPFRLEFWRSPLRGPWLTSFLGSALLPLVVICALTGYLSQAAYNPNLGSNAILGVPGPVHIDPYFFSWPTTPSWLYAVTQGLHVICGVAAIPLLLAKLWSAMPKLFEWPPTRSLAHILDRLTLAFLVGGSLFVFATGLLNIQLYYPWKFSFIPAHYYGAFVFLAALALHVGVKFGVARRAFREHGVVKPLKEDLAHTEPEPFRHDSTAPKMPAPATLSRRGLLAVVGAGSAGMGLMVAGQVIGGPLRPLALLAPRGQTLDNGPNGFRVNKTASAAGIDPATTGETWRLKLQGGSSLELSREQLLAMDQYEQHLPIACVEGWSTTQTWTGVRLGDLAALAGIPAPGSAMVTSLEKAGAFNHAVLQANQILDPDALLALRVNGAELTPDHGYPARIIVPALPGVHNTKWVSTIDFRSMP